MAKDSREKLGIHRVAQKGDNGEEEKEAEVKDEENVGYYSEPVAIVRELMEEDGHDASAHCDNEPAIPQGFPSVSVSPLLGGFGFTAGIHTRE